MPDPKPSDDASLVEQVILTDEGALTPEQFALRTQAALEVAEAVAPERIDDAALLSSEQTRVEDSTHGGLGDIAETALRQGVAGLTLGTSNLLIGSEGRERARLQNRANSTTAALAELGGGLAPGLFTGGTGALGTIARLSPAGKVAALAGRVSVGGKGMVGRVATGAAREAIQGAAQGVGNYLAREALEEDRDFSAESLASAGGIGALVGGAAGGLLGGIGAARARARAPQTAAAKVERELIEGLDAPVLSPGSEIGEAPDAFFSMRRTGAPRLRADRTPTGRVPIDAPTDPWGGLDDIGFDEIVSPSAQKRTADVWGDLVQTVDDKGARALSAGADDLPRIADDLDALGVDAVTKSRATLALQDAATNYRDAAAEARRWTTDVMGEVGADVAQIEPGALAKVLPDALDERGALSLARLDDAAADYQAVERGLSDAITEGLADAQVHAAGDTAASAMPGIATRVSNRIRGVVSGDTVTSAIGAVETARDLGVDVPLPSVRDIPVIGEAMALYVKAKAGIQAGRKLGVVPGTSATRAARQVNQTRTRITNAVSNVARSATVRALGKSVPGAAAREVAKLMAETPETVAQRVRQDMAGELPDLAEAAAQTAARAQSYLMDVAPKDPMGASPMPRPVPWEPTGDEVILWERRRDAVRNPGQAVESSMSEPYPDLEAEALRAVYPAIYAAAQAELVANAPRLMAELPDHRLQALGRAYGVPLTINQLPGYPAAVPSPPPMPPTPSDISRGPGPTTSPAVTTELTAEQARARGRV